MFLCSRRPTIGKSRSVVLMNPITISLGSWCVIQYKHRCWEVGSISYPCSKIKTWAELNQSSLDPKFSSVSAPDTWEHRKEEEFHGNILTNQFHPRKKKKDLHVQNNTIFTRSDHGFRMSIITCQQTTSKQWISCYWFNCYQ